MVKNHLKRIATPRTWSILRKTETFVTRPNPGAHTYLFGTSLNTLLKEYLGVATTRKEVKKILHDKACLVDGKVRHDERFIVGFLDVVSFPSTKKHYRIILNKKGKLAAVDIKEAESTLKVVKIKNKHNLKGGKTQISTSDGRVIVIDKDNYQVGDSLLIELPSQAIKEHFTLTQGVIAVAMKGKHAGELGEISKIEEDVVTINAKEGDFVTRKSNVFITGNKKASITCSQ